MKHLLLFLALSLLTSCARKRYEVQSGVDFSHYPSTHNTRIMPDKKNNLDRAELVDQVAASLYLSDDQVNRVLDRFFYYLRDGLATRKYVEIHNFGSFSLKTREAKRGTTPGGKSYSVGKRYSVNFNAGKEMRDVVEQITGLPCLP